MDNPSEKKAERVLQIEAILLEHPEGMTQAELARRLGVNRSTISRYFPTLPKHIYVETDGRWKVDRSAYLVNVRFNLHEALAVHLAARLLTTRLDRQNPHAAAALRKLGIALERLAPQVSQHLGQSADVMDDAARRHDPHYLQVLERLTLAWAEGRKLKVWHRKKPGEEVFCYTFSPYFLEPYAVGQTIQVIGLREPPNALRTFRVDRIERVETTEEAYEIPADFDPRKLLEDTWGIWYTDQEPQEVVLRFHPNVTARVRETQWHRSEQVAMQPDGYLLWRAWVAEPREMLPWIRGWGADVEVLAPEDLRNLLKRETQRLLRLYHAEVLSDMPKYFQLWAKAEKTEDPELHPLIYHMLDVGACALALWNHSLSEKSRQSFAHALHTGVETAGKTIAFWAALHDLGKAAPGFQRKYAPAISTLEQIGFTFLPNSPTPAPHGVLTAWALKDLLVKEGGLKLRDANLIALALGGHHGVWPTPDRFFPTSLKTSDKGDSTWDAARRDVFLALKEVYGVSGEVSLPQAQLERNSFLVLLSGLVSVADWLGSMTEYFPFTEGLLSAHQYAETATARARTALEKVGWLGWQADGQLHSFATMFPEIQMPNAIQQQVFQAATDAILPALVILEAPTGIGKTEAALQVADNWLQTQKGSGLYIAMPTQATSNQMYDRFVRFLKGRYPAQTLNTHLVHGGALLTEEQPQIGGIALDEQQKEGNVKAETWFLPRKRTLLAPFGVGTVDQALMSVLQTHHFFVRMFGLGQKVLIFDEVHAYDTYMSTLFERLLNWLRANGTSVILLSATLPEFTRKAFVRAWSSEASSVLSTSEYPRLTIVSNHKATALPLPTPPSRTLHIQPTEPEPEQIARHLGEKLAEGGCAAVICNRVQRAQEVYQAIQARGIVPSDRLILFHARFPYQWRKDLEEKVLSWFSKDGKRPDKAIIVATQVIEQSLDLDFDYMLTDLAPIDLLLQRAGRLQRHAKNNTGRPTALQAPCLAIANTPFIESLPDFGLDGLVYDRAILLRTWLALRDCHELTLPEQTSSLIEYVYGQGLNRSSIPSLFASVLQQMEEKARLERAWEINEAKKRLIASPEDEGLLSDRNEGLEEDDVKVNEAFRALTRLSDPGVPLICLHQTANGIALDPDSAGAPVDLNSRPSLQQVKDLLRRSVNVQRREVVDYFLNQVQPPSNWKKSAALRNHFPIIFDANGEYHLEEAKMTLKLSRELGLEFRKEEK